MTETEVLLQQLIIGLSNGSIIALIAMGYTMVYGIIELINFAHGDLFMLGAFFGLTVIGLLGLDTLEPGSMEAYAGVAIMLVTVPVFCGSLNWSIDRIAYKPLRNAPRVAPLVSAIGVSFILMNIGLFWGGLPMEIFGMGSSAAAPKDFPALISSENLLGDSVIQFSPKDLSVIVMTVPILVALTALVQFTSLGRAMRAVAQNQTAARLMGIDVDRIIGITFVIGGALGGFASVIYALYNNTIYFQMGFRVGMDAFTAAILGGIGSMPGAMVGGLIIGLVRALSDQYIATKWTNTMVFTILILVLIFRPNGLFGKRTREKV